MSQPMFLALLGLVFVVLGAVMVSEAGRAIGIVSSGVGLMVGLLFIAVGGLCLLGGVLGA